MAQPPDITETDKAVLRDMLGFADRDMHAAKPCGADAMRAAAQEAARQAIQKSGRLQERRNLSRKGSRGASDLPTEHFDRFCRYPC